MEILASELRIGNWVRFKHLLCFIITIKQDNCEIQSSRVIVNSSYDFIEPIPLTPEILEKCGFSFGINLQSFVRGRHQFVEIKNMIDGYLSEDGVFYYGVRTKIQHLHQLQNLYFALTGKELTFKQ